MTVLDFAVKEIGVTESPKNSNKVKYNTWYYGREVSGDAYPWCMAFVQWCFNEAGTPLPYKTASCSGLLNWYKKNKPECIVKAPLAGDIAIFSFGHTGIVESFDGAYVTCIEGNTSKDNASNGGEVMRVRRKTSLVSGFIHPFDVVSEAPAPEYFYKNDVHIMGGAVKDFRALLVDCRKRSVPLKSYINGSYFSGARFPVPLFKCDIIPGKKYASVFDGATFSEGKYFGNNPGWTGFYGKKQTCIIVSDGKARIDEVGVLPDCDYCIGGVPIMRHGEDVSWKNDVLPQGWDIKGRELYATGHCFVGLKKDDPNIYLMGCFTKTSNMVLSAEAYKKFKALGFNDVIKLDGGGSYIFSFDGKEKQSTGENRVISVVLGFAEQEPEDKNISYNGGDTVTVNVPVIKYGSKGNAVKTLQAFLNASGYNCGAADGDAGTKTITALKAWQKANGLTADGIAGQATWGKVLS